MAELNFPIVSQMLFLCQLASIQDNISWDVEAMDSGKYEVELYYTRPAADTGSVISLSVWVK